MSRASLMCLAAALAMTAFAAREGSGGEAPPSEAAAPAAEGAPAAKAEEPEEEAAGGTWMRIKQGGLTMVFLFFLSVMGLTFAMERAFRLRRPLIAPEGLGKEADKLWREGKHAEIKKLADSQPSTLGRILSYIVEHRKNPMADLSTGAAEIAGREFKRHLRRAYPLAVVGTLSPLLGLLGTVSGLMDAFEAVAVAGTMDDPSILANSIAKALVTTLTGLVIAVPALVAYHFFKSRTGDQLDMLEEEVSDLMNGWYMKKEADEEVGREVGNEG